MLWESCVAEYLTISKAIVDLVKQRNGDVGVANLPLVKINVYSIVLWKYLLLAAY